MNKVNVDLHLDNVEYRLTREGYGEGLVEAGENNSDIIVIGADITSSVKVDLFKSKFPERFFNIGIAEQNQIGIAAGLSLTGKIPFVTNYGVFLAGRTWDQIRTTICYSNLNVKLGGAHGGISVGPDGATHQALEEISIMRCIPNMKVVVPCDYYETKKATLAAAEMYGPIYIRFGREKVPVITDDKTPFEIGKAYCLKEGKDVTIIACGAMVYEALKAAEELSAIGISAMVINNHTIKPLDKDTLLEAAKITNAFVTVEEHQIAGGMGSAIAEFIISEYPIPIKMVGIEDRFGESGDPEDLLMNFGLKSNNIVEAVKQIMLKKKMKL